MSKQNVALKTVEALAAVAAAGQPKRRKEKKNKQKVLKKEEQMIVKAEHAQRPIIVSTSTAGAKAQRKMVEKVLMDKVIKAYIKALIDPDSVEEARVPDGFPVPTVGLKSIQTIEVVANYNANSITDGNGGRFFYQISPTIGTGATGGAGYVQIATPYTNIGPIDTEAVTTMVLGTKVAGMMPSVRWQPGYIQTPGLSDGKSKSKTKQKDEEEESIKAFRDHKAERNKLIRGPAHLMSDSYYNGYEFWMDPNSPAMGGYSLDWGIPNGAGGLASMIRPVALSVWFQPAKSILDQGGDIATCLLPAGVTAGQIIPWDYATPSVGPPLSYGGWTGYGPLEMWENLAQVPGSYQGKLASGTYTYWVPEKISDMNMVTPLQSTIQDYPTIVVAGQYTPNAGDAADATSYTIGRLRIVAHYEYVCQQQTVTAKTGGCTLNALEKVKLSLRGQPTAMANEEHKSWISKILDTIAGGILGFAAGGPAGAAIGAANGYMR